MPLLLGSVGMTLLAVGAMWSVVPLLLVGAGVAVVGFAAFLIGEGVRQSEIRAARKRSAKKAQTAPKRSRPAPPVVQRNPLADAAVEALTGDAKGGIWPPLASSQASAPQVSYWAPGAKVATPAFDDEMAFVDLEPVAVPSGRPRSMQIDGGSSVLVAELDGPAQERDYRVWPGARDLGRWSHFTGESSRSDRYTKEDLSARMKERRALITKDLPTVGAILAEADRPKDGGAKGMTKGKCSQCEAALWAPTKRPITLKCPGCGHKARLY
ncbi:MAG TPA: hypothetical protein VMN39_06790 [Longimicrobiaceae bacterium]|nr:hypothetical protein [Longimicrobiaceae bacterium]